MIRNVINTAARVTGLTRAVRFLNRRRGIILMYHGLTEREDNRDWTQLKVDDFSRQMQYLSRLYRPLSMQKLVDMLDSGRLEPYSVAVTFDDGYESNYAHAYPILKQYGIPATIFVTSGFVLGTLPLRGFLWPDYVSALLKSLAPRTVDWRHIGLGQHDLSSPRTMYSARNSICEFLKSIDAAKKDDILTTLDRKYGDAIDPDGFGGYRPMTAEQVRELARGSLVTIGAHSRTHPILSRLEATAQRDEIVGSKSDLEAVIAGPVNQFAYPNGRRQDIDEESLNLTSANFSCAVTTEPGLNRPGQDRFLLHRIGVGGNLHIDRFKNLLSGSRCV